MGRREAWTTFVAIKKFGLCPHFLSLWTLSFCVDHVSDKQKGWLLFLTKSIGSEVHPVDPRQGTTVGNPEGDVPIVNGSTGPPKGYPSGKAGEAGEAVGFSTNPV